MTAFYLIFFGVGIREGMLIWAAFAVGFVVLFFVKREDRCRDRELQISSEVIERYPDRSAEELYKAYGRRRRTEMRQESLLWLCLAVETALWLLALYAVDAAPISLYVGFLGIVPVLLLLSIGLLIASFFVRAPRKAPTIDAYLTDPDRQRIMTERSKRPDHRSEGNINCLWSDREPWRSDTDRIISEHIKPKKQKGGIIALYIFAFIFFVVIPHIGILLGLIVYLSSGDGAFLPLLFAVICVPVDFTLIWLLMRNKRNKRDNIRRSKLLRGKYQLEKDRILSVVRNENVAYTTEVCFDRQGTVSLYGADTQEALLSKPYPEALLLTDGGEILEVIFTRADACDDPNPEQDVPQPSAVVPPVENRAAANRVPVTASQPVAVPQPVERIPEAPAKPSDSANSEPQPYKMPQNAACLTEEQILEEAEKRLASTNPVQRTVWEDEINRFFNAVTRLNKKSFSDRTKAEKAEADAELSVSLQRSSEMDYQLAAIEDSVIKRLHVTRAEIAQMKKNPFVGGFFLALGIALVAGVGGNLLAALINKYASVDMSFLHVIASAASGLFALRVAERFMAILRFRKLQKAYRDPRTWERVIDAKAYKLLYEQIKAERKQADADTDANGTPPESHTPEQP